MINIDLEEYNYELPSDKIAQYPLKERDRSKLLIYNNGIISESYFNQLHKFLPENTLLVFNNTSVVRARLIFRKETGADIEILCLEPLLPSDYAQSFTSAFPVEWKCIVGNNRKWNKGILSTGIKYHDSSFHLYAERICKEGDAWRIRFIWNFPGISFGKVLEYAGHVPLPPYIRRKDEEGDKVWYQTIYSAIKGSVAAPTAGLHFTKAVLDCLRTKGIKSAELTLHVGAGTFQPVKSGDISKHIMHTEHFYINKSTIEALILNFGKIIAVGTTSVRTLESLYWVGMKIINNPLTDPVSLFLDQWEPYKFNESLPSRNVLELLLDWMNNNRIDRLHVPTRFIIIPDYRFRLINGMITNFHLPKSTLLLLISAYTGKDWRRIYNYALENDFRFLSYGDSSLLLSV